MCGADGLVACFAVLALHCVRRDIRAAFEEVKKTLYDMNREKLLKEAAKIKQQQKEINKQVRNQQNVNNSSGGCGCTG